MTNPTLSPDQFILWETRSHDTIDVKRCYIDLAEDLISGVLLSQVIYWHLPSRETGKTRLVVEKDGFLWLVKGREEWWEECRITADQFDRAIKILERKELVVTANYRYQGLKKKHVRLNWDVFLKKLAELPEFPNSKFRTRPAVSRSSDLGKTEDGLPYQAKSVLPKVQNEEFPNRQNDLYTRLHRDYLHRGGKNSEEREKESDIPFSPFESEEAIATPQTTDLPDQNPLENQNAASQDKYSAADFLPETEKPKREVKNGCPPWRLLDGNYHPKMIAAFFESGASGKKDNIYARPDGEPNLVKIQTVLRRKDKWAMGHNYDCSEAIACELWDLWDRALELQAIEEDKRKSSPLVQQKPFETKLTTEERIAKIQQMKARAAIGGSHAAS